MPAQTIVTKTAAWNAAATQLKSAREQAEARLKAGSSDRNDTIRALTAALQVQQQSVPRIEQADVEPFKRELDAAQEFFTDIEGLMMNAKFYDHLEVIDDIDDMHPLHREHRLIDCYSYLVRILPSYMKDSGVAEKMELLLPLLQTHCWALVRLFDDLENVTPKLVFDSEMIEDMILSVQMDLDKLDKENNALLVLLSKQNESSGMSEFCKVLIEHNRLVFEVVDLVAKYAREGSIDLVEDQMLAQRASMKLLEDTLWALFGELKI